MQRKIFPKKTKLRKIKLPRGMERRKDEIVGKNFLKSIVFLIYQT